MKKLLALALSVMLLLSVAVCAQGMETTGRRSLPGTSPARRAQQGYLRGQGMVHPECEA